MDCLQDSYYQSVYTSSCFPIALVSVSWCFYLFNYFEIVVMKDGEVESEMLRELLNKYINLSLFFVFIFLPPVAGVQFRALDCVELDDGSRYLRDDTGIDCDSNSYAQFALINGILIALYQSLPLCYVGLLCHFRDRLNSRKEGESVAKALRRRDNDKSLDAFRFLFNDTSLGRWYFEVIDLYRRVLFTGVLPLLSKDPAIRAYIGCLLAFISIIYFREQLPYRTGFTNIIGVVAQYLILIVFLAALMIQTNTRELFQFTDFSFGVFMVGVNCFMFFLVLLGGYLRYKSTELEEDDLEDLLIEFDINKFKMDVESMKNKIPKTHDLVYYYTSLHEAKTILRSDGIPALKLNPSLTSLTPHRPKMMMNDFESKAGERGGIVVSTKAPHELTSSDDACIHLMSSLALSKEAVLCLSLPRNTLCPLEVKRSEDFSLLRSPTVRMGSSFKNSSFKKFLISKDSRSEKRTTSLTLMDHLRVLPVEVLEAMQAIDLSPVQKSGSFLMRGSFFGLGDSSERVGDFQVLSSECILASYQLKDSSQFTKSDSDDMTMFHICDKSKVIVNHKINMRSAVQVTMPQQLSEYMSTLTYVHEACVKLHLVPLYCYTSRSSMEGKLARGFALSPVDQKDVGLFFTPQSPSSLGLDTPSYESNVIKLIYGEDCIDEFLGKGYVDLLIVYGAEPSCIEMSSDSQRVVFGQQSMRDLAKDSSDLLRPDRIFAAMHIPTHMNVVDPEEEKPMLTEDIKLDQAQIQKELPDQPNQVIDNGNPFQTRELRDLMEEKINASHIDRYPSIDRSTSSPRFHSVQQDSYQEASNNSNLELTDEANQVMDSGNSSQESKQESNSNLELNKEVNRVMDDSFQTQKFVVQEIEEEDNSVHRSNSPPRVLSVQPESYQKTENEQESKQDSNSNLERTDEANQVMDDENSSQTPEFVAEILVEEEENKSSTIDRYPSIDQTISSPRLHPDKRHSYQKTASEQVKEYKEKLEERKANPPAVGFNTRIVSASSMSSRGSHRGSKF